MRVLLAWSSGKDSAWTLYLLRRDPRVELVGLLTTFNERFDRVAMHGVRRSLVQAQADAVGVPLWEVFLPWPCSNADYEEKMAVALEQAVQVGVTHVAFGDIHLEDVRAYRERQLRSTPLTPLFPLWGQDPDELAQQMVEAGLRATLVCIDGEQLSPAFLGRTYDADLLDDLPVGVDPCGERGEFHTFCYAGPMFHRPIPIRPGESKHEERFHYLDLLPRVDRGEGAVAE